MASMWPPKKNTAFTLYFTLYKNDGTIVANPGTITKKVSIDGAAVADIVAAVTEEDTTYGQCSLVFAAGEMNGDAIWYYITDNTAGTVPLTGTIYTTANTQDEIGTAITAIDDYVDTEIATLTTELAKVPKSDSNVTWNATALASINTEVDTALNTAIPGGATADSINERIATMDTTGVNVASQSNIDFGALQKTSLNAATPASVTGAVGSVTGAVGSVTGGVTVTTNNDKTGYALSTAGILAIWHQLTAAIVTASTIGKLIVDYLDAAVSGVTAPTAIQVRDAILDRVLDGNHEVAGSTSVLLQAAGAAADPLLNAVPGAYASGTAGHALGRISSGNITVTSPVATDGHVTIIRGDDYNNTDGRALDWANTDGDWPDLTGATIAFVIGTNWTMAGSVVTPTGTGQKVRAEPTAALTAKLKRGEYEYDVIATLAVSARIVTLASDKVTVDE